jgi:hypothetical protein
MSGGIVAWSGPSVMTGRPIVLIITARSANTKTGPMRQAWILPRDLAPLEAATAGQDADVCGSCIRRPSDSSTARACYVALNMAPLKIWRAFQAGAYPAPGLEAVARALQDDPLRVAAYGDPAAVPADVWRRLRSTLRPVSWVAYTHAWRTCDPWLASWCMASVDTPEEGHEARRAGWRTFRARLAGEPLERDEITCPASDEAGRRVTCLQCRLCQGTAKPARSIAILEHGARMKSRRRYTDERRRLEAGHAITVPAGRPAMAIGFAMRLYYWRRRQAGGTRIHVRTRRHGETVQFWLERGE